MDVVYPYKVTADDFELRFSLRSLSNVKHDSVVVAGERPQIIGDAVRYVPVDVVDNRFMSSTANILAAAKTAVETDDFIVMHDDIFILEPWTFRHEYRCTIAEYLDGGFPQGEYRAHIEQTRDILNAHGIAEPLWYGLHTPTAYNRAALIDLCEQFAGERFLLRTLYHNMFQQPSQCAHDVKVRRWKGAFDGPLLSISDEVGQSETFRDWISEKFQSPSPFEAVPMQFGRKVQFIEDFSYKPRPSVTIAYKAGMTAYVRLECSRQAISAKKAVAVEDAPISTGVADVIRRKRKR